MATGLSKLAIAVPALLIVIGIRSIAAQIATDGRAGPRVDLTGPDFQIGADLGTRAGRNLFHSFERFSLRSGERATFSGPNQIRNVINRVTGGVRSDIDGTIRSTIPSANFYFLNPAGVAFGPNARLDLQGSFHVSTADELRFADGVKFSAASPTTSSFTVAAPEAFGFLGAHNPAPILVDQSVLEVPTGKSFSIVGGDVDIIGGPVGFIAAEAGKITLAAVGGPGEVRLGSGAIDAVQRADISLTDRALVETTGNGGGVIRIRGEMVVAEGSVQVFADNNGNRDSSGGLDVDARVLQLHDGSSLTADVVEEGTGSGGRVRVRTNILQIEQGSDLAADTFAEGNAGKVSVVTGQLTIDGAGADRFTGISSLAGGESTGNAGTVQITADIFRVLNDGEVSSSTFAEGDAGGVTVEARELTVDSAGAEGFTGISSTAAEDSSGNAGRVEVTADTVTVLNDGNISSDTFAEGEAGEVTVRADQLTIDGAGEEGFTGVSSNTFARGDAGSVTVTANRVLIAGQGAQIGIASEAGIFIDDDGQFVVSEGDAGSVTVVAGDLEIRSAGVVSSTTRGKGDAGEVAVAVDSLLIDGEGSFFVTGVVSDAAASGTKDGQLVAVAQGAAGSVTVAAREIELRNFGQIRSSTFGPGDAGAVAVGADRLLIDGAGSGGLTGVKSEAARSAFGVTGDGDAGAVTVTANELEILNSGRVSSSAAGQGVAGAVVVVADELKTDGGAISTDSAAAGGGEIRLLVKDFIDLRRSAVTTSVAGGADSTAGNILIDPKVLVIDGSRIEADAGEGSGGNIEIFADSILVPEGDLEGLIARGEISASGPTQEVNGEVSINAPEIVLASGLVILDTALLDAGSQLRERCGTRRDIGASSFTGVGRGGLPPSPDGPLVSAYVVDEAAVGAAPTRVTAPADGRLAGLSAPCAPLD